MAAANRTCWWRRFASMNAGSLQTASGCRGAGHHPSAGAIAFRRLKKDDGTGAEPYRPNIERLDAGQHREVVLRIKHQWLLASNALGGAGKCHVVGGRYVAVVEAHPFAQGHHRPLRRFQFAGDRESGFPPRAADAGEAHGGIA